MSAPGPGYGLDIDMTLQDDTIKAKIGREPKVRWSTTLDMTPDNTALDFGPGKNVRTPPPFSPLDTVPLTLVSARSSGQLVKVKVKHRVDAQDNRLFFFFFLARLPGEGAVWGSGPGTSLHTGQFPFGFGAKQDENKGLDGWEHER